MAVAVVVVVADQVTKSLAVSRLDSPVHLVGPLGLALGFNSGSAFGLFTTQPVALSIVALVVIGGLVAVAWQTKRILTAVALGLVLGGALGNLADRAFRSHHGSVVDFITLTHWPTFNLADASITIGLVLVVVALAWPAAGRRRPAAAEKGSTDGAVR